MLHPFSLTEEEKVEFGDQTKGVAQRWVTFSLVLPLGYMLEIRRTLKCCNPAKCYLVSDLRV